MQQTHNEMNANELVPGNDIGHIRCLGVVPVEIDDLLKEIQLELDSE